MGSRKQMYAGRLCDLVACSRAPKSDESGKLFLVPGYGSLFDISRVDFCRRRVYLSRRWIWIPKRDDWLIWKSSGKFRTFPCACLKQQPFPSRFSVSASLCLRATILQLVHNSAFTNENWRWWLFVSLTLWSKSYRNIKFLHYLLGGVWG